MSGPFSWAAGRHERPFFVAPNSVASLQGVCDSASRERDRQRDRERNCERKRETE